MAPTFVFRPLAASDLPLLAEWLARPHVAERWGAPADAEDIAREYGDAIASDVVWPYVAWLDGEPVAFIQAYDVMNAGADWWADETDSGARGIDQFLANEEQLGRGLGTALVTQFVARLFDDPAVTKVQADPSPDNARAIRAYEKAGLRRVATIATPDGPALLMVIRREDSARS
jgi:RimJ/RimL family protein N-acetyltransferase